MSSQLESIVNKLCVRVTNVDVSKFTQFVEYSHPASKYASCTPSCT
jgi:hypothetical protein